MEPLYVKAGSPLRLVCEQTQGFKTKWLRLLKTNLSTDSSSQSANKYKPITSDEGFNEKAFDKHGKHLSVITKEVAELDDSGSYSCDVLNNLDRSYYIDVNVFEVISNDGVMVKPGEKTNLLCRFNSDQRISPVLTWYKDGVRIDPDNDARKYSINSTSIDQSIVSDLIIRRTYEHDIGTYECHLMLANNVTFVHHVQLNSAPMAKISERSVVVRERDATKVVCLISGWPMPRVQWFKGHDNESLVQVLNGDDDDGRSERIFVQGHVTAPTQLKLSSPTSSSSPTPPTSSSSPTYPALQNVSDEFRLSPARNPFRSRPGNSTLIITEAKLSDRDVYICEASSEVGNSTTLKSRAVVMVRVKGRYASVYPIVGVILEFVVLIIIIIVYERKKRRNAEEMASMEESNLFQPLVRRKSENKPNK